VTAWGVPPDFVRQRLQQLEWDNIGNLRDRLLGKRSFPIRVSLRPPTGRQALDAMSHFQAYMAAWREWPGPGHVEYQTCNLTQVGLHDLPTTLVLAEFDELARFLGPLAHARHRHWEAVFEPLHVVDPALRPCLVRNLASLEILSTENARQLAATLCQLRPGLGHDNYLRALPLVGVDTKFVEQHLTLLTELADVLHAGAVSQAGSLEAWLQCRVVPRDWLYVRPLCKQSLERLGGIELLQVATATLITTPLPARKVLVVENVAAGYALPPMADTIAVFGGGANVRWTQAAWLTERQLGYWGDIDTWGLHYLATVRRLQPHVHALLMDHATVQAHLSGVIDAKEPNPVMPDGLTSSESDLYQDLLARRYGGSCLEQERISADWCRGSLDRWSHPSG
jgi:hypothetical protein